jgi:peptidoglycan/xylan/chitin deacetylase (PgdA/CDA1 family)
MRLTIIALLASSVLYASVIEDFYNPQLMGRDLPNKTIALTFDDGPAGRTEELAEYLMERDIPATFFMTGKAASRYPQTVAYVASMGHLLANHSWRHKAFTTISNAVEEIARTDREISEYIPNNNLLFRAPYGDWSSRVVSILNNSSVKKYVGSIFWDVGGSLTNSFAADWACWSKGYSVTSCGNRYLSEIRYRGRGIVLMHDVHSKTVDMVKYIVPKLIAEGYKFVLVDEVPNIAEKVRFAGGTPTNSAPPTDRLCYAYSESDGLINVRSGPSTSYEIIDTLHNNDEVKITSRSGSWYKVSYGDTKGYIYQNLVRCH